ncbi:UPF0481 protein At3g47200-like [Typha latifolia]|uniref:UPF0481 protein At3g47200-like n=1 Tax=Typha latifolia TaxID=4733 RepID=UPI003C2E5205
MRRVSRASETIVGAAGPRDISQEIENASYLKEIEMRNALLLSKDDCIYKGQGGQTTGIKMINKFREAACEGAAAASLPREVKNASKFLRGFFSREKRDEEHKTDRSARFLNSVHDQVRRDRKVNNNISCTIYQVPPKIRSTHAMAYTPMSVCIGPFFCSDRTNEELKQMQDYKWTCVRKLMSQDKSSPPLQVCLTEMKKLEKRIRASYSDEINMKNLSSDELAEMMLLDGCLILHLLLMHSEGAEIRRTEATDEDGMQVVGIWNLMKYDLLLLENQIPFFVIIRLFRMYKNNSGPDIHDEPDDILVDCGLRLFSSIYPCRRTDTSFSISSKQVHHLLHLVYLSILPSPPSQPSTKNAILEGSPHRIPSARELHDAGVKFKKSKNAGSFLDIKFSKGVMEIPSLEVYDYSNSLFRNLIAFEQCYPNTRCQITTYAAFMDCLLSTPEDARLLHQSEILTNNMTTDQDAARFLFFSRLCNQVHYTTDNSYLRDLCVEVNKYQHSRWHKWRAILAGNYFSNPWLIISLITGAILLLLAAGETFFTIYPFYHK